jgi:hypothetical protein
MTSLGRMSKADLDALPSMDPVTAALTLRAALARAPAACEKCGRIALVIPRSDTTYAGRCLECGGRRELLEP